ncbi:ABC transporter permease [Clostridiaceae bacterium 35-E11]
MKLTTLALRNIKQNFQKYIMYFFSLSFSVFTVYSFLALMQNEYVIMAFTHDDRYRSMLMGFGIIIMVFVMFFLISSNNSFIKARKKEISTYALFGMTNRKIGKLLFLETMLVGFTALVIGISFGIFFSKLTAMILLDITLASFTGNIGFTIDPKAVYITTVLFISIFCFMGLSGLWVINKFELVDLFKAGKVSEGKSEGSIILLILSFILMGTGYYLASSDDPRTVVTAAIPILMLVIMGTYLFFWSGLPKVLNLIKRDKKNYYQGVNLIATSAFSHRMKSIGSVMATIAVLSAVATTAIATGFTLYRNVEKNTYDIIGYDMYFYSGQEKLLDKVYAVFEKNHVKITETYTTERYQAKPEMKSLVIDGNEYLSSERDYFRVYSQSVYNKLISLSKSDLNPIDIDLGEAMYVYPYMFEEIENAITGQVLIFSNQKISITSTLRSGFLSFGALHTLVLNDNDFDALLQKGDILGVDASGEPYDRVTVFNYEDALQSEKLNHELTQILSGNVGSYRTAYNHYNESLETFGLVCFIGFFMSGVFMLMTASLLYFKQVMAAEEERHQYRMLRKIGMDSQVEKKVIIRRLLPVFFIPLFVGIVHSMFAMKAADTIVFSNMIPVENSYFIVLAFSAVMYGAYAMIYGIFYLITKGQYARIVR